MVPRKFHTHQLGYMTSYPTRQQSLLSEFRTVSQKKYINNMYLKQKHITAFERKIIIV
jgi:hypothetical protein